MAKITALPELTTPVAADVLPIVDDVAGTPVTKKLTLANLEGRKWVSVPANQGSSGTQGDMATDGFYSYLCKATNTWVRTSIETTFTS